MVILLCMTNPCDADQSQAHSLGNPLFLGLYFGSHKIPSAVCYLLRAADAGVGRLVPDVAFTDLAGKPGKLSDYKANNLLVVAVTNTTCPLCKKYAPSLARLEQEYGAKGVAFLFVNPTATDKPASRGSRVGRGSDRSCGLVERVQRIGNSRR